MTGLILPYRDHMPEIAADAFVAPTASVIGNVVIASRANIWFNCVLRGDEQAIRIGANANIQDGTVIHVDSRKQGTYIGADVIIGHMALIHACTLEDRAFVAMGATVLDEAVIESDAMLAAGAMLTPGKRIPSGELWAGSPAKKMRDLRPEEIAGMKETIRRYAARAQEYLKAIGGRKR